MSSSDNLTAEQRRKAMRAMRSKNTRPEIRLRLALWRKGYRYRMHRRVAGTVPDLVFSGSRTAVFVDGCFWHGCPTHYVAPVANAKYWEQKVRGNQVRDARDSLKLEMAGYRVIRVWECEIRQHLASVVHRVEEQLRAEGTAA